MRTPLPAELAAALDVIVAYVASGASSDPWVDARHAEIGQRAIRDAVRAGKLEGHRVAKKLLVRRSALDAYIAAHRVIPEVRAPHDNVTALLGCGRKIA